MMILWELFGVFARIGAITFGGGYAMVSLIEREITDRMWLTTAEFADIVAVSQMTPGPLALNVATYVGRQTAGVPGALVASLGLAAPAVVIISLALLVIRSGKKTSWTAAAVRGIRAAALGLIGTAILFFMESSVLRGLPDGPIWSSTDGAPIEFSPAAAAIFVLTLFAAHRFKLGPIRVILGAAALGLIAFAAGLL